MEAIMEKRWSEQAPIEDIYITREELDLHIRKIKDELVNFMDQNNLIGLQLFKNVFLVNDIESDIECEKCRGNLMLIHYDSNRLSEKIDMDMVVWKPALELLFSPNFNLGNNHVFPIIADAITNKEVSFKCLNCTDSKWHYMSYEYPFGLGYNGEEVKCVANAENVESHGYNLVTVDDLEKNYPENSIIMCSDARINVENLDMEYIHSWVDALLQTEKAKTYKIIFTISGYDSDRRELWEIPEVRKYMDKLLNEKPEFLWFLQEKTACILCYSAKSSAPLGTGQVQIAIDMDRVVDLSKKSLRAIKANNFFNKDDIRKYMQEFNSTVNQPIYNL